MNTGGYIILAGLLVVALFGVIVSYREDHPKASPSPDHQPPPPPASK